MHSKSSHQTGARQRLSKIFREMCTNGKDTKQCFKMRRQCGTRGVSQHSDKNNLSIRRVYDMANEKAGGPSLGAAAAAFSQMSRGFSTCHTSLQPSNDLAETRQLTMASNSAGMNHSNIMNIASNLSSFFQVVDTCAITARRLHPPSGLKESSSSERTKGKRSCSQ